MKAQSKEFRKLENVEPFNGYLFRSCYYHQLIAAYAHFGIDKNFIMMKKYFKNSLQDKNVIKSTLFRISAWQAYGYYIVDRGGTA